MQTYASEISGQKCEIFCILMENRIKLLIRPGIPFWKRKYSTNLHRKWWLYYSSNNLEMSKSYVAEKQSLDAWTKCKIPEWLVGMILSFPKYSIGTELVVSYIVDYVGEISLRYSDQSIIAKQELKIEQTNTK